VFGVPEMKVHGRSFGSMDDKNEVDQSKLNIVNYIIFLIIKTNEMHYFSNLFDKVLYIFL